MRIYMIDPLEWWPDRHHHSTIVLFDIAFLELQWKLEMEIFCNCLPMF
jgi:hypothetical protein